MSATNLTDAKIAGLKAVAEGRFEVPDKLVPGLRVRVGTSGAKTFILRKRVGGRISNITLGRYGPRFTLAEARKKARMLLIDIDSGGDPRTQTRKTAGTSAGTIRNLFADYEKAKVDRRSIREIKRIFEKYILPEIGDRLADSLNRADVTRLVDSIAAPVMARGVAAQLSAFYTWAMPRLHRLDVNPCRDAGRPEKPKARERVLSGDELRVLWEVLEGEGLPWGPGIKLLKRSVRGASERAQDKHRQISATKPLMSSRFFEGSSSGLDA